VRKNCHRIAKLRIKHEIYRSEQCSEAARPARLCIDRAGPPLGPACKCGPGLQTVSRRAEGLSWRPGGICWRPGGRSAGSSRGAGLAAFSWRPAGFSWWTKSQQNILFERFSAAFTKKVSKVRNISHIQLDHSSPSIALFHQSTRGLCRPMQTL